MAGKVKGVPDGTHSITAHLIVNDGQKAVEFYKKAFGGTITGVHLTPDGKVMHAEVKIGDSRLMLADEFPGFGCGSPKTLGGSPVVLNLYSEDVDSLFNQAVAPAQPLPCRWPTSSGATATGRSPIPMATAGRWGSILKMFPPRRWNAAPRKLSRTCRNLPSTSSLAKLRPVLRSPNRLT